MPLWWLFGRAGKALTELLWVFCPVHPFELLLLDSMTLSSSAWRIVSSTSSVFASDRFWSSPYGVGGNRRGNIMASGVRNMGRQAQITAVLVSTVVQTVDARVPWVWSSALLDGSRVVMRMIEVTHTLRNIHVSNSKNVNNAGS